MVWGGALFESQIAVFLTTEPPRSLEPLRLVNDGVVRDDIVKDGVVRILW